MRRLVYLFAFVILAAGVVSAANTDTVVIDINVTQEVSIDVTPNSTSWYGVSVGSTTSATSFQIQNIGSVNISTIDASITNAASNPYGTGSASNFNAGDFIQMNASTNSSFYYINKKEFNESMPAYVTPPTDWTEGKDTGYFGRFRTVADGVDTGQEYLFFTNRTAPSGNCSSNGVLLIAKNPKTVSNSGDTDFSNSGNYTLVTLNPADNNTTGEGEIGGGHPLTGYCVQVSSDCSQVTFFHFNMAIDDGTNCGSDQYVFSGTLEPGNTTEIWLRAKIPNGVSEGDVSQGTLTFTAAA